jgi:hypothetical protein
MSDVERIFGAENLTFPLIKCYEINLSLTYRFALGADCF